MFQSKRWLNLLIVLTLLLGLLPAAGSAPRAQAMAAAPAPPDLTDFGNLSDLPPAPAKAVKHVPQALLGELPDSQGRDFWLAFPGNAGTDNHYLELFIAGNTATTGTVTIPGVGAPQNFTITPGAITAVSVPTATAEVQSSDVVENLGIHVQAGAEVTVYGLNRAQASTDAFLGLPADVMGTEYIVLAYTALRFPPPWETDLRADQLTIVATMDNTTVAITPTVAVTGVTVHPAGVRYTVSLNQGQTYQLRNYTDGTDLSGSIITSDKPIAVFGGHECTQIPHGYSYCDYLVEQLPPVVSWGKAFVTVPLATRTQGDTFRFLAAQDNTTVLVNGVAITTTLNRGQFHEQVITTSMHIISDKPILVAQYSNSTSFDGVTSDPFMMLVPPYEQFLGSYTVSTPESGFRIHYINVAAPTAAVNHIMLDGYPIMPALFQPIGASGFSGAQIAVFTGTHNLTGGAFPFGVFSYGYDNADSYGYPGGTALAAVATVATVTLSLPAGGRAPVGAQYCIIATATDVNTAPVNGVRIDFTATGVNSAAGFGVTNASGEAPFCYTGLTTGNDTIVASVGTVSDTAVVEWVNGVALNVSKTGSGSGAVTSQPDGIACGLTCTAQFAIEAVVTLTATPAPTSTFAGWSGAVSGMQTSVTVTMNSNKAVTATFTLRTPALAIAKTAEEMSAPPLLVGDRILYTIRVTNTTTGTLTNLRITDTLPSGVDYFGIPKGSPMPAQTGAVVVWTQANLAAGAVREFKVIVKATGDVSPIGDNVATATCAEDAAPVAATANLADPGVQEALALLKDAMDLNGAPLLVNDVIRYPIYVTNTHASVTLTGVVVTDTLPAGTVFVTATQPYTMADGVLWWQVGSLAPGAHWMVAVDQRVDGSVNPIAGNIAAVWCDQQDWQTTGEVYPPDPIIQTALKIGKTAEEYQNTSPLLLNDRILYTIRITNTGASALTNLRITDTLPSGVEYFGIPKGSPQPAQTGPVVVWTQASLAAGAVREFKVIVKVNGSANPIGVNQAQATCVEETTPAAAAAQVPGDGVHAPGLVITGTAGSGTPQRQAAQADTLIYALTLTNTHPTLTMHTVIISAMLPSGVTFVSATPPTYTGEVTLTWTLPTLGPGAVWQSAITVAKTGAVGEMTLSAASDEQSPVEATIAAPGEPVYRFYLPLVIRQ